MISRRVLEIATAVLTGTFGATVAISSLDNGIGWSTAGVEAGAFPFLVGLIILLGSLYNLVRSRLDPPQVSITRADMRALLALFLPAAAFVAAIPLLGMYVATAAYMLGVLAVRPAVSRLKALVYAGVTPLLLYLVFEWAFQVSLPHGVLGEILGF
ncbi:MAG: tripartite tricarboxylate transporter TctB family protein [Alphaproteobacteria bacterium]|nr:tripartite tricarboxylate transporter TctB family protein [Alphaproteobacteria bacterium]